MHLRITHALSSLAIVSTSIGVGQACSGTSERAPSATSSQSTATGNSVGGAGGANSASGGQGGGPTGSATGGGGGAAGGGGGSGPKIPTLAECDQAGCPQGKLALAALPVEFQAPMGIVSPWGDAERQFVFERAGKLQLLKNGVKSLFLDLTSKVVTNGEFGFLGLAFHPDYAKNGRFFVHYSGAPNGMTTIEEYRRQANDPNIADPLPVGSPILTVNQPAANHDGGTIEFSPVDGLLYIALGDGGGGCDTYKTGQNMETLLAKIARIDVSTTPYSIPPGNAPTGRPEIFIGGLRNPFRTAFDVCTGDLYIGDVGQGRREEIDVAPSGKSGLNYGWSVMEGTICANGPNGCNVSCDQPVFDLPIFDYAHESGRCSITGGRVYRGHAIPWLRGTYLYSDFCTGEIWGLRYAEGKLTGPTDFTAELGGPLGQGVTAFGEDEQGELYVVQLGGTISRFVPKP